MARLTSSITPVEAVEIAVDGGARWAFAEANRAAIDAHFARAMDGKPSLHNSALYLLSESSLAGGAFRGRVLRTDYASFLYWRDAGFPDPSVRNLFGAGALHAADGALILGVMGAHTANAGCIYPPSGSPEDGDVTDGRLGIAGNISREIAEETGLAVDPMAAGDWLVIETGALIALVRRIDLPGAADDVAAGISAHLAREEWPELAGLHVVRRRGDIVPDRMPAYTQAYIRHAFAE